MRGHSTEHKHFLSKKKLIVIVQMVLSAAFLFFSLRLIDLNDFLSIINSENVRFILFIPLLFIALFLNYILALRWKVFILTDIPSKYFTWELFKVNLIARFFAIFLPGQFTSDAYRIYILNIRIRNLNDAFVSVFFDRYIGQLVFFALGSFVVLFYYKSIGLWMTLVILCIFFSLFIIILFLYVNVKIKIIEKILYRFRFIRQRIYKTMIFLRKALYSREVISKMILYSLFYQFLLIIVNYLAFLMFLSNVSIVKIIVAMPIINLLLILPASINGIGQREAIYIFVLSSLGFQKELALSVSIIIFTAKIMTSMIGGLFYLIKKVDELKKSRQFVS